MANDVYRLVYYSRNRMTGTPDDLAASIATILNTSQANNGKVGVTGALMFNSGFFGQVLEGPQAAVESVFERIQQDDRHGEVSLLAFETAPTRSFEGWSMGFVGASVPDAARYGAIVQDSGFDPTRMSGNALFETLHHLALDDEKLAAA
ncbi:BLUF domain-containing protein [Sphingomonas solaris]|uniref:BLUF domain-containing protein n=1 Tax=Alterirhizorhabdus solaris TaxID=2529389 RepID=A0A558QW77_9SPHN|nr:BLUF domain-containing protein [Sphingomonas solaris]TVV71403.1 BLUF domain-containing protein [Sphingomonas solaris]